MKTTPLPLLLLCLSLTACKVKFPKFRRPETTPAPTLNPEVKEILLPLSEPGTNVEIFEDWLAYLTQPRLAFWDNLKTNCQQDPAALTLRFSFEANSFFQCDDLVAANALDARWKCLSPTQIQYTLPGAGPTARCENLTQFLELPRLLKLPSALALYKAGPAHGLTPNVTLRDDSALELPRLRWNGTSEARPTRLSLHYPDYDDWLRSGFDSGAIALVLELDGHGTETIDSQLALYYLLRLILQQKEPSKLRFYLNPGSLSPTQRKKSGVSPFFTVQGNDKDPPLFRDSCDYVNKWLKAQQILAGLDPATNPMLSLQCVFRWGDKSPFSNQGLTLTKLPLPLAYTNAAGNEIFPFRFLQDGLSAGVFRSLKKP